MTPNVKTLLLALFRQRKHRAQVALGKNRYQSVFICLFMMGFFYGATLLFNGLFRSLNTLFKADVEDVHHGPAKAVLLLHRAAGDDAAVELAAIRGRQAESFRSHPHAGAIVERACDHAVFG